MKPSVEPPAGTGADADPIRRKIVAAARSHFFTSGFRGVTMDDLAGELGMSKKTLYARFPAKSALLEAVLEAKFACVNAEMQGVIERHRSDFLGTLQEMLAVMLRHMEEIHPAFLRDMRREGPEAFVMVESRRNEAFARYFGHLLQQGRAAGVIRKDLPVKLMVEILLGAVRSIMNPAKLGTLRLSPKAAISAIVSVILEGAVTETARPLPTPSSP